MILLSSNARHVTDLNRSPRSQASNTHSLIRGEVHSIPRRHFRLATDPQQCPDKVIEHSVTQTTDVMALLRAAAVARRQYEQVPTVVLRPRELRVECAASYVRAGQ